MQNEEAILFTNPESSNTGEYGDESDLDERLWASVEMYYMMDDCHKSTDEFKYKITHELCYPTSENLFMLAIIPPH